MGVVVIQSAHPASQPVSQPPPGYSGLSLTPAPPKISLSLQQAGHSGGGPHGCRDFPAGQACRVERPTRPGTPMRRAGGESGTCVDGGRWSSVPIVDTDINEFGTTYDSESDFGF